jgi:hypothetical protein
MELIEDGTILESIITAPWTIDELLVSWDKAKAFRDAAPHKLHAIIDISHARPGPPGLVSQLRHSPALSHPRRGELVVISPTMFARALLDIASKMTGHRDIRFVESREAGLDYLHALIARERTQPKDESSGAGTAG